MKDAYSFDLNKEGMDKNYQKMLEAYNKIFLECGLDHIMIEADSGAMGGNLSHEFMVPAEIGEDILYYCNQDKAYYKEEGRCPKCNNSLLESRMVEIGHIFQLGTKYSLAQEGLFLDNQGKRQPFIMGCYGIGVSRVLCSIAQKSSDDKGMIWPKRIAPYEISLVVLDDGLIQEALAFADQLEEMGLSVLVDERKEPAGVKFKDAYLIGNPYILIMGKKYIKDKKIELEVRKNQKSESFSKEELINFLKEEYEL